MTADLSRPDFVRRYLRRGWWLFVVTTVLAGWALLADRDGADTEVADDVAEGRRVEATVDSDDGSGDSVRVRYEHPIFGPSAASLDLHTVERRFRPDDQVAIVASRIDPDDVAVPGDTYARVAPDWVFAVPPVVALLLALRRRRQVRRTERSLTDTDPPAALLAQLRASPWPRRRVVADLYPLEATAGSGPLCSVPLISSGGLPIGGGAATVQVRTASPFSASSTAQPGPWRAVSLRTEDGEPLWPRRRASGPRVLPRRFGGRIADPPAPALLQDLPPGRRAKGWWVWCYRSLGLLLPGLALFVLVFTVTADGAREAEDFAREALEVPAEIVRVHENEENVVVAYRVEGVERRVETTIAVTFPEDYYVGQKRLAVVDPESPEAPERALLLGDLYDTSVPRGLAFFLVLPGAIWAVRELLLLRRLLRLSRGPWYEAEVLYGGRVSVRAPLNVGLKLGIGRPGATAPSCVVVVAVHKAEAELRSLAQQQTYDAPWWQARQPATPTMPPDPTPPAAGDWPPMLPPSSAAGDWPPYPNLLPVQGFRMAPRSYAGPVLVAGTLAPGEAVVLRIGDLVVPAIRAAKAPKGPQPVPPEETRVAAPSVPPVPRSV